MQKKIKVCYFVGGNHLYGDNKSLLEVLLCFKDTIEFHVIIKDFSTIGQKNGRLSDILDSNSIRYSFVSSVLSPPRLYLKQKLSFSFLKSWLGFIVRTALSVFTIFSLIRKFKPDIIHSNNGQMYGGFLFSKIFNVKHVWHLREYIDKDHGLKHFPSKNIMINSVAKSYAIANSTGVFDYFEVDRNKGRVIYNPIGLECVYDNNKQDFILFVGRIIPSKGIRELVSIFSSINQKYPNYKLLIAGGYDEKDPFVDSLFKLIDHLNIKDSVTFLGYCSDVDQLMRTARCLVVPSFHEAFGRITIEALFSGCLVIGRNTGGTKEIIQMCENGFLFDTDEQCLMLIDDIIGLDDNEYYNRIVDAQSIGIVKFSSDNVSKEVLNFYHFILP